jgi:glycosyltransferase
MKFSIITISYNPGRLLKDTIDSVLSQDYPNIEYIIIDGSSTDGTMDLIKSYDGSVSQFICEPDKGLYDALNKGIALATGDVIGLVHADDVYADSSVLSSIAKTFETSKVDVVYGDIVYVSRNNTDRIVRYWRSGEYWPSRLKYGWMPPHTALYVTRAVYEKARLANGQYFDTSFTCAADYDFMMRVLGEMKISVDYLPVVLIKMRMGGVSNRSLKHIIRKSREDYRAMKQNNIGGLGTLLAKNFRKLPQFFKRNPSASRISMQLFK